MVSERPVSAGRTVALLSPCGHGNLGDAAIQDSAIAAFRARVPGVRFVGITLVPGDTKRRHGIPAVPLTARPQPSFSMTQREGGFPIPESLTGVTEFGPELTHESDGAADGGGRDHGVIRGVTGAGTGAPRTPGESGERTSNTVILGFLRGIAKRILPRATRRLLRSLRAEVLHIRSARRLLVHVDALVVSGGGQLDEFWGGAWGHPWALAKWTAVARWEGKPVAVLSVGTGSLEHRMSRILLRSSLRGVVYCSYRDAGSKLAMQRAGLEEDHPVVPDLAFSVPVEGSLEDEPAHARRVAVSPIAYMDPTVWPSKDHAVHSAYVHRLASVVAALLQQGTEVVLVSSDGPDRRTVAQLKELVRDSSGAVPAGLSTPDTDSVRALQRVVAACGVLVASRLHGVLLSMVVGTPVVALSYDRKVRAHMSDMGEESRCLDIEAFDPAEVAGLVTEALRTAEDDGGGLQRAVSDARNRTEAQYDEVTRLLGLT